MHAVKFEARHLPFFNALGTLDPASSEWAAAKAGLVTLRLLDTWLAHGPTAVALGDRGRRAVDAAIDELPRSNTERQLLANIVMAMLRAPRPAVVHLAAPLLAYAHALQVRAAWVLAADVYESVLDECGGAAVEPARCDLPAAATAALRLGSCHRQLGDRARAAEAYAMAEVMGARADDVYTVLKAQLGRAKLTVDRGNLPEAEELCDAVIGAATRAGFSDIRAEARYERAHVAARRGQAALAASLAFESWTETTDPMERDRVLVGLAAALADVGHREAARDANLLLAAQACDPSTRWVATINLVEIAALDHREIDFLRHRRALERVPLPPPLAGYYHLYVAQGYRTFGQLDRARRALDQAIAIAEQHRLNELLIRAEALRNSEDRDDRVAGARATMRTAEEQVDLVHVAEAIRGAREMAGIAG
jgi:tetratricopeptide (TPR) repeat protein